MKRIELRELGKGDRFSLYPDSPGLEIIGIRAPEMYRGTDIARISTMLFGNTYTLRRLDGAGGDEPFEIDLDALQYVYQRQSSAMQTQRTQWLLTVIALMIAIAIVVTIGIVA